MRNYYIYTLLSITLCFMASCSGGKTARLSDFSQNLYTPQYALGFDIKSNEAHESSIITVRNPWQGADGVTSALFITRNREGVPSDFNGQVLNGNAQRIIAMSSTQIAMLDAIGQSDKIVGVSGIDYISSPNILERRDSIVDIGYESNINYELLLSLKPDIVLLYSINGANAMEDKLKELDIPYMYVGDYLEESPLGKAEWLVALSEIVGRRDIGEKFFTEIPPKYNRLKDLAASNVGTRPKIMINMPYAGSWFMPPSSSYAAQLVEDAGGELIYKSNSGNTSKPIDIEEAYELTSNADIWINTGMANNLEDLRTMCPKFMDTQCVMEGKVYNNNRRVNSAGGNDYYESAVVCPDLVLRDLVKIFHPELVDDDFVYYKQLR